MRLRTAIRDRVAALPPRPRHAIDALYQRLPIPPDWTYNADGLATIHYTPFLDDAEFMDRYDRMAVGWFADEVVDVRWRMWLLTRFALQARELKGDYAEFGVYRGGCSWMLLSTLDLDPARRLHLFDTFEGIPQSNLAEAERQARFGGRLSDTSQRFVAELLAPWHAIPRFWPGDVFETMPTADTGQLAFAHIDLNAAAPTVHVLEHVYDRLVPGGIVVLDDYAFRGYEEQRGAIDDLVRRWPEDVIALPTGQGVLMAVPR